MIGLFGQQCFAQMSMINSDQPRGIYSIKGDYFFDHQNLVKAIEYYSKSVKEKPKDVRSMLRMAEAFNRTGDIESAVSWYQKSLTLNTEIDAGYILKYVYLLLDQKKYEEALEWSNIYHDKLSSKKPLNAENNMDDVFKDTTIYIIKNLDDINSADADLDPVPHHDRLFFASDRFSSDELTVGAYNLYNSASLPNGAFGDIKALNKKISSELNEGPFAIAKNTNTLYFTRNDVLKGAAEESMSIFYTDIPATSNDKLKIKQLSFKDFEHNIGHPTFNTTGAIMYFIADTKENGRGLDLYRSELQGKNWSTPQVLGPSINTNGNEAYPFLHNDSILYFASNGHGGLGGFDMYKVNLLDKQAQVENLGVSVNTSSDELGLIIKENTNQGYLSSDRPGGLGGFDLYGVQLMNLKVAKEEKTDIKEPVSISIFTSNGKEITLIGDSKGNFSFRIETGLNYGLVIDKVNYQGGADTSGSEQTISTLELTKGETYNFFIQKFVDDEGLANGRDKKIQDLLGYPGDLITFQFTPIFSTSAGQNTDKNKTRLLYKRDEVKISSGDTIVFGYQVEEMPKAPGPSEKLTPEKEEVSLPLAESTTDSTSLTDEALSRHTEEDQEVKTDDKILQEETPDQTNQAVLLLPAVKVKDSTNIMSAEDAVANRPENELDQQQVSAVDSTKYLAEQADSVATMKESEVEVPEEVMLVADQQLTSDSAAQAPAHDPPVEEMEMAKLSPEPPATKKAISGEEEEEFLETVLQYRVQIAASKVKLDEATLKNIYSGDRKLNYFEEEGYYKYYIGEESNFFAARQILVESSVEKVFIAAYMGDVKYVLKDAIAAQYREQMTHEPYDVQDTILLVEVVNFKSDEFALAPNEKLSLLKFTDDQLKDKPEHYVIVNGHTDTQGSDAYNYGLSVERALFVRKLIIDEGISTDRVKTHSFGESQLAKYCNEHGNCEESVHKANRRVEVILLTTKVN